MNIKPRLFYGWWLVVAGFVIVAYGTGIHRYTSQPFQLWREEFGGTVAQLSFGFAISGLVGTVTLLAIGPLIDRFGPRRLMLIGIPMVGFGFVGLSAANTLVMLSILLGTLGVGMRAGFLLPVQTATANWFFKRRSMALALISAAPVIGGALTILLEQVIASQFPWRGIFLSLGLVMLTVGLPLALLIRHRPEEYGYLPDGESAAIEETGGIAAVQRPSAPETNFTLRQALRTKTFWILSIGMVLANASTMLVPIFQAPLMVERGFPIAVASISSTITSFMVLVGILLFGYLGDLFPKRYLLALAIVIQSFSVVILLTGGTIVQLLLYPLVYGLGSGTIPLLLAIRADYFGRKAFATITAATIIVTGIVGILISFLVVLVGWIHDITGSYYPGLLLSMPIGFIGATVFFFARSPVLPQHGLSPLDHKPS